MASQQILRMPAVVAKTGLSRSTIYLRVGDGTFPQPIKLGERSRGFIENEIDAWIEAKIEASRRPRAT